MNISSGIIHCHSIQKAKIIPRMKKKNSEFLRISPNCRNLAIQRRQLFKSTVLMFSSCFSFYIEKVQNIKSWCNLSMNIQES